MRRRAVTGPRRTRLFLGLWLCLVLGPGLGASDVLGGRQLPGPAPQGRSQPAAALNAECERCHPEIAAEWRDSYHRRAYSDEAFQRALAREPLPFCRRCHAPEADPRRDAAGWARESGVACVTCHVFSDRIFTGVGGTPATEPPPHPVQREPRLSSSAACAGCHEFQFPDAQARRRPELMQATLAEHRASAAAERSCIDCHMPRQADGHRSHRFLGGHDAQTVRGALMIRARREPGAIVLELVPQAVGHALPTGDLFRRITVEVEAPGGAVTARYLMRQFVSERQLGSRPVRVTEADSRLVGPTALRFPSAAGPVRYRVRYQRVAFPKDHRGGAAEIDGEIELAAGTLP